MLVYIHKKISLKFLFLSDIFFHLSGSNSLYLLSGVLGVCTVALFIPNRSLGYLKASHAYKKAD